MRAALAGQLGELSYLRQLGQLGELGELGGASTVSYCRVTYAPAAPPPRIT